MLALLRAVGEIAVAFGLGLSVRKLPTRQWALWSAAATSAVWLYLAMWTVYDVRLHAAKWESGDGAEGALLLLPFGVVGLVSAAVMLGRSSRDRASMA